MTLLYVQQRNHSFWVSIVEHALNVKTPFTSWTNQIYTNMITIKLNKETKAICFSLHVPKPVCELVAVCISKVQVQ